MQNAQLVAEPMVEFDERATDYRLPAGVVGLVFGPHTLFGRRLYFARQDGSMREATGLEVKAFMKAFPAFNRPLTIK